MSHIWKNVWLYLGRGRNKFEVNFCKFIRIGNHFQQIHIKPGKIKREMTFVDEFFENRNTVSWFFFCWIGWSWFGIATYIINEGAYLFNIRWRISKVIYTSEKSEAKHHKANRSYFSCSSQWRYAFYCFHELQIYSASVNFHCFIFLNSLITLTRRNSFRKN